jgi:hypothetical protein
MSLFFESEMGDFRDGDINPYYATPPLSDDAIAKRDWTGKQLGDEVVGLAKTIHPEVPREPEIDFADDVMSFPLLKDALFLGYANGYFDYFPTVEASTQGGYGAADSNTYVQIGAGERMVRQGLTRVYEMLGRLREAPEKE